jgi:hypothetical protein
MKNCKESMTLPAEYIQIIGWILLMSKWRVRLCLIINCLGKRDSECEQEFEKLQEYFSKFKGIVNTETKEDYNKCWATRSIIWMHEG